MDKIKKQDDLVIKALDLKVIRRLICITDKGQLDLVIRKGENNYFLSIDSVPLEKEMNDKLMGILFKPEVPQQIIKLDKMEDLANVGQIVVPKIQKKMGRPAKVK